ncbi:MAG: Cu(I)-responsive transcriptional regulator [Hyphomicrobiaceae bacterium]|nr:Cu(I)-responsive transcriptional regulator [Hyphomicrobiaceae bacterium]
MIVGQAAKSAGLPAKTLRYYEEIGLVEPARLENGYRDYDEGDLSRLKFLSRARSLGFSISDCRALLSLGDNQQRSSRDVKAIASAHLENIEQKIAELRTMKKALAKLVSSCHGDEHADCPIIDELTK